MDFSQHPTVSQILDFLLSLHEKKLGYSAIDTHCSALSTILQVPGVPRIRQHVLVIWLMNGIFNMKSPRVRYTKTWYVNRLSLHLRDFGPNDDLSQKDMV